MKILNRVLILFLTAALFLIPACATTRHADDVKIALKPEQREDEKKAARVKKVLRAIKERNKTIESSHEWLEKAYRSPLMEKLNDIPQDEYQNYKKFAYKNTVYIIVHPAYYVFMQNMDVLSSREDAVVFPKENLVERFYKRRSIFDPAAMALFQEQERILRDFLEFMSAEKRLIIVILPGDYKKHLSYGYIEGLDEYARYINEVTNESESVIYVESISYNQGELSVNDIDSLLLLLQAAGVKNAALGGGYFGRCLGAFYEQLGAKFGFENIYFVPELTAISPEDLSPEWINGMLTKSGRLNIEVATQNLLKYNPYGKKMAFEPRVRNLPFLFYRNTAK